MAMRKIILSFAMSLDGCMAEETGALEWLHRTVARETQPPFLQLVDTVVLDWNAYYRIATELSPGEWADPEIRSYVLTDRRLRETGRITFRNQDPAELLSELKQQEGGCIWVFGGTDLVRRLLEKGLFDELVVTVVPRLLGKGSRLFDPLGSRRRLKLLSTWEEQDLVDLHYEVL